MREKYEFYILAMVIGIVQGGIQALSRSYYSRLIPKKQSAQYFGFYNMLGKFAAIIGPALIGFVGLWSRRLLMPESPSEEQIIEVPVKPEKQTTEVLVKQPSTKKIKTIRKKLLF